MPLVGRRHPLPREDVAEVTPATRADNLGASAIGHCVDGARIASLKRGPPAAGVKLCLSGIEGRSARGADKVAQLGEEAVVGAREGTLGALAPQHRVLGARQLPPPGGIVLGRRPRHRYRGDGRGRRRDLRGGGRRDPLAAAGDRGAGGVRQPPTDRGIG